MKRSKKPSKSELELAVENLKNIPSLDEQGKIELLLDTQSTLNNGDASAYFEKWLDAVCEALKIELDDIQETNPFA